MTVVPETATEELIGLPTAARLLGVTRETARTYALRSLFSTRVIDGRTFAVLSDVVRFKSERDRAAKAKKRSA